MRGFALVTLFTPPVAWLEVGKTGTRTWLLSPNQSFKDYHIPSMPSQKLIHIGITFKAHSYIVPQENPDVEEVKR